MGTYYAEPIAGTDQLRSLCPTGSASRFPPSARGQGVGAQTYCTFRPYLGCTPPHRRHQIRIAPWESCHHTTQLLGGTRRFILSTSGHIAALANPPDNPKASFQVDHADTADARTWQQSAETIAESWWTDYLTWMASRCGPEKDAPNELGGPRHDTGPGGSWYVRLRRLMATRGTADQSFPTPGFVNVDGLRLRVDVCPGDEGRRRVGQPPLLLIMGLGGHLGMWEPLQRALAGRGITTIAYDAPGTGQSTAYRWPKRASGVARTVEHLLDELGQDRVDTLGVSLGGGLAQQLAHQAPERVRRLVLAATSTGSISVPGRPSALLALASPRRYRDPDYYRRVAGKLYGGRSRRPGSIGESPVRFAQPPSLCGYLGQLYITAGWTSLPWLNRLTQPTLVLTGGDDPIVPPVNGRILARLIPDSRLVVLPGAGHLFLGEEVETATALITEFLLDNPGTT
jgi:poly(3-hydroxyoctanoate) depolymerase